MGKIKKLDFTLGNIPQKHVAFGQAIMLVSRKVNEVIEIVNSMQLQEPSTPDSSEKDGK